MKRGAAHRYRRAAFLAVRGIVMIEHETRETAHAKAWAEMRERAEQFDPPRDGRGNQPWRPVPRRNFPACHSNGAAGAV